MGEELKDLLGNRNSIIVIFLTHYQAIDKKFS